MKELIMSVLLLTLAQGLVQPASASTLQLQDFLSQVKDRGPGIIGVKENRAGLLQRSKEAELVLAPTLFANAQEMIDKKQVQSVAFQGNKTQVFSTAVGVAKQTDFGLQFKASYNLAHYAVDGVNPALVPIRSYIDAHPTVELTQSLWRNGLGSETKANLTLAEGAVKASVLAEDFKVKMILLNAETSYWRLVMAREMLKVQKENLERALKIERWSTKKSNLQLSDRSDLLQASAMVSARQLELQTAESDERAAARAFNTFRNLDQDEVTEKLEELSSFSTDKVKIPRQLGEREDVLAARELKEVAAASATASVERNKPTLEVFASQTWNGRDNDVMGSVGDSLGPKHNTSIFGVRYSVPLDRELVNQAEEGHIKEKMGAAHAYEQKALEASREWKDLQKRLEDSLEKFKFASNFELRQKEKLEYEKGRFNRGRSTTFQVIQFEQDFATSQLARLKVQSEILGVVAQMKTFGGAE